MKDTSIDIGILREIDQIDWFSHAGEQSALSSERYLRQVGSWKEADSMFNDSWEEIRDRQRAELSLILPQNERNGWNQLLNLAHAEVATRAVDRIASGLDGSDLEPFYNRAVSQDIVLYLMEMTYAQRGYQIPIFFRNLFAIYQAGHMPCGWGDGDFPEGFQYYY